MQNCRGSALMLAIEEWLTPAGHVIWHKGITPNVVVALPAGISPELPAAERTITAKQLRQSRDTQLLRALALLQQTATGGKEPPSARLLLSAATATCGTEATP